MGSDNDKWNRDGGCCGGHDHVETGRSAANDSGGKHPIKSKASLTTFPHKATGGTKHIDNKGVHQGHAQNDGHGHDHVHDHDHDHDHEHGHDHDGHAHGGATGKIDFLSGDWLRAITSFLLLITGLVLDHLVAAAWFTRELRLLWYVAAYLPVGFPILIRGIKYAFRGDVFTEFFLMSVATVGAFYVGEYPEGVAVMVFYAIGELFQDAAVSRAKRSIKALLDVRPDTALVWRGSEFVSVSPESVEVGETIRMKPGDRVPLDGIMLSDGASFNTAALTGESKPSLIEKDGVVLAGMINEDRVVEVRVSKPFDQSSLARILTLVQHAQGRKAKTELFIRKFARVYTPIVVFLAMALTLLPIFFVAHYNFQEWLYRALIFLVISCPCALVVAIPLGYFGGIGAGSRNGILFKGSSYLDLMARIGTVVMDKTGTLTHGVFKVQAIVSVTADRSWLNLAAAIEEHSNHPTAKAVVAEVKRQPSAPALSVERVEEIRGHGLRGIADGQVVLVGNVKLMKQHGIVVPDELQSAVDTLVIVAIGGSYKGHLVVADEIKKDASQAVQALHKMGISTIMLSGDKQAVVNNVAAALKIDNAHGDLLPEDKVSNVEEIKRRTGKVLAFVGDGINDAPVLAISDVGIAMGGLGSDAAIETADVVIQTDQPSRIVTAVRIGKATTTIVWQNIALAFGVKLMVMALGAWGVASMWEAVFADVGVALLAILNAVRIQRMKFV